MEERLRRFPVLLAVLVAVALPAFGIGLSGRSIKPYLRFPPRAVTFLHPGFSWPVFILLALGVLLVLLPFLHRGRRGNAPRSMRSSAPYPWWGWIGVALSCATWALAWTRFEWFAPLQRFTFTPLWLGLILAVNGLTVRRKGHSLMTRQPAHYALLFPLSAAFWWYFEYLNRFVGNWRYEGLGDMSAWTYIVNASISFSTVLPAVTAVHEWLASHPHWGANWNHFRKWPVSPRSAALTLLPFAVLGLAFLGLYPEALFPLLWLAPLILVMAFNALDEDDRLLEEMAAGRWRNAALYALAALICGFFWEMWNVHSLAKWVYAVPFVDRFHVFEMPILGFAGYLPFGLECALVAEWAGRRL